MFRQFRNLAEPAVEEPPAIKNFKNPIDITDIINYDIYIRDTPRGYRGVKKE